MKRVPQRLLRQEGRDLISSDCGSALLDALRGRLQSFTRPELFRSATANTDAPPPSVTVGMDDLDDLLLRSNLTLPLKALIAVWHAALQEVGCQNVSAEEAPGIRLGYAQFGRAFGGTSVESQGSFGVAAPKTANFSFKATGRYFSDDQHRRPRPVFSSNSTSFARTLMPRLQSKAAEAQRATSFEKTLACLVQGLDEGSVRLALQMVYSKATAQKMKEVFKERQRCRQKGEDLPPDCDPFLLKTFKKRVAIANQYFAEVVEEWHAVKSSPGPRCVMVEYPMPFDWQCDVQVYEAPQQRPKY
ncbi:unnamed protein product [Durusdinium trenchii]|uniref:Uncharacterized protein n=1 Tax=Durusdinium trenchii TaxID=1381693 RepID=A0ABP0HNB0_9DINO